MRIGVMIGTMARALFDRNPSAQERVGEFDPEEVHGKGCLKDNGPLAPKAHGVARVKLAGYFISKNCAVVEE